MAEGWTLEQRAAILSERDTLLSANAGSGKTTTVVAKILWLLGLDSGLDSTGAAIPPCPNPCELHEIAAITFTEKAAYDLKRKLRKEIEKSARAEELRWKIDRAFVGTIHAFCANLLREQALRLGIDPTFDILDEQESRERQDELIRQLVLERLQEGDEGIAELFRQYKLSGNSFSEGAVGRVREALKDLRWHRDRYREWCNDDGMRLNVDLLRDLSTVGFDPADEDPLEQCDALYRLAVEADRLWIEHMREENVRDYDALVLDTLGLLTSPAGAAALRSIRKRFRILIIDEFQDTDSAQADIAYAIGGEVDRPQLFFVGDPKQSIYRFRGAEIAVWNQVSEDISARGEQVSLTTNFRSQPELIEYLNRVGEAAIEGSGEALDAEKPEGRVRYADLIPGLESAGTAGVEFLGIENTKAELRRDEEGEQVARRILEMVRDGEKVVDPDSGEVRPCRFRDFAILYRTRTGIDRYQRMLALYGIPVFNQAQGGLSDQQEIADVINALRLIENPANDVAAFAFLRSPFVGLRDEVSARIAMQRGRRSLLQSARAYAGSAEWWTPPEGTELLEIERTTLASATLLVEELASLAARLPLDELIEILLDRTGYRVHLLLMDENREALANLQTLIRVAEQYRKQPIGDFLDLWARWVEEDVGLPQAPLYSAADDVVTMTTVHRAKGLEWPIVFLIDVCGAIRSRTSNEYWSDQEMGPLLAPAVANQGARAKAMVRRLELEQRAEEARLLYVAATRARDRLIVLDAATKGDSYLGWLLQGKDAEVVSSRTRAADIEHPAAPSVVELAWLERLREVETSALAGAIPMPVMRYLSSATEVMMKEDDAERWALRYVHGVEPGWQFAARRREGKLPANVRGTIIHGALERYPAGRLEEIEMEEELARILDEVIGELDAPELEPLLGSNVQYRQALEQEIAKVVSGAEWRWYSEGEHYRELPFLHIVGPRMAYIGAFDLYRPDTPVAWIIDFKTHDIEAPAAARAARAYDQQARLYREAAAVRSEARVRLHFTRPGTVIDMGGTT